MDEQVEWQLPDPDCFSEMLVWARKSADEALTEAKCGQNQLLIEKLQAERAAWQRLIERLEKRYPLT